MPATAIDHGGLVGLADDDHSAYPTVAGVRATGTWPIGITGDAGSVGGLSAHTARNNEANKLVRTNASGYTDTGYINYGPVEDKASNPSHVFGLNSSSDRYLRDFRTANLVVDYADRWDGFHITWSGQAPQSYFLMCSNGVNVYPVSENYYARGIVYYGHVNVGTLAANTGYGPWTWGHGLGGTPSFVVAGGTYDDGVHSLVGSVGNLWDATNVQICGRNVASSDEACSMGFIGYRSI